MKKLMFLLATMVIGFTTMADVKPEVADAQPQQAQAQALIPVYAQIKCYLYPYSPYGEFMIEISTKVFTNITYTVQFRGHTNGTYQFVVNRLTNWSPWYVFPNSAMGQAQIIAVSPESDGTYDYTAAIGAEIEW